MAVTFVAANTYTPTSSITSRSISVPAGVADGDLILIGVTKGGGASACSMSGLAVTNAVEQLQSGQAVDVWYKENALATDAGTTITVTSSAARVGIIVAVYRGLATSGALDASGYSLNASGTSVNAPSVTASATDVRIDFGFGSTNTANVTYIVPGGATSRATVSDAGSAGAQSAVLADNLTTINSGAASGANVYTTSASGIGTGITLLLKAKVASTTVYPTSQVSNAGSWVNVGGATSYGVLADGSDSTYIETPSSPAGASIALGLDNLASGQVTVTARARYSSGSSGSVTVKLMQGATVIATWTQALTSTMAAYSFTTTAPQTAAITDFSALRVAIEGTAA